MASEFTSKTMDLTHLTTKHEIESSTMDISTTEHWMIIWICVGAVRVYTMSYNQLFIIHHYILQLEFNIYIYMSIFARMQHQEVWLFFCRKKPAWRTAPADDPPTFVPGFGPCAPPRDSKIRELGIGFGESPGNTVQNSGDARILGLKESQRKKKQAKTTEQCLKHLKHESCQHLRDLNIGLSTFNIP